MLKTSGLLQAHTDHHDAASTTSFLRNSQLTRISPHFEPGVHPVMVPTKVLASCVCEATSNKMIEMERYLKEVGLAGPGGEKVRALCDPHTYPVNVGGEVKQLVCTFVSSVHKKYPHQGFLPPNLYTPEIHLPISPSRRIGEINDAKLGQLVHEGGYYYGTFPLRKNDNNSIVFADEAMVEYNIAANSKLEGESMLPFVYEVLSDIAEYEDVYRHLVATCLLDYSDSSNMEREQRIQNRKQQQLGSDTTMMDAGGVDDDDGDEDFDDERSEDEKDEDEMLVKIWDVDNNDNSNNGDNRDKVRVITVREVKARLANRPPSVLFLNYDGKKSYKIWYEDDGMFCGHYFCLEYDENMEFVLFNMIG